MNVFLGYTARRFVQFVFVIVTVFLSGLMVGRTPEYLGKKVEAREMKLAMLALLCHPVIILVPAGLFAACAWGQESTSNPGPHGLSQILYEFSSSASGNGSGFEGLGDTVVLSVRFPPIEVRGCQARRGAEWPLKSSERRSRS